MSLSDSLLEAAQLTVMIAERADIEQDPTELLVTILTNQAIIMKGLSVLLEPSEDLPPPESSLSPGK
jgi:hypothetical protein